VSVSEDSITAKNHKGNDFWGSILKKYMELLDNDDPVGKYNRDRLGVSMQNRFIRKIEPEVTKFNECYKKVKTSLESGKTEEDYMKDAMLNYWKLFAKDFKFSECLPILWAMPQFDPMVSEVESDNNPSDVAGISAGGDDGSISVSEVGRKVAPPNKIGRVQGMTQDRPPGKKIAQQLKQIEAIDRLGDKIGAATDRLAKVIERVGLTEQRLTFCSQLITLGQRARACDLLDRLQPGLFDETPSDDANENVVPGETNVNLNEAQDQDNNEDDEQNNEDDDDDDDDRSQLTQDDH
jgi:hypothetical protein